MKSGYIVMSFSMTNSKQPGGKQDIGSKESKDSDVQHEQSDIKRNYDMLR